MTYKDINIGEVWIDAKAIEESFEVVDIDENIIVLRANNNYVFELETKDFIHDIEKGMLKPFNITSDREEASNCNHKFVNVGFNSIKMECYYCGVAK